MRKRVSGTCARAVMCDVTSHGTHTLLDRTLRIRKTKVHAFFCETTQNDTNCVAIEIPKLNKTYSVFCKKLAECGTIEVALKYMPDADKYYGYLTTKLIKIMHASDDNATTIDLAQRILEHTFDAAFVMHSCDSAATTIDFALESGASKISFCEAPIPICTIEPRNRNALYSIASKQSYVAANTFLNTVVDIFESLGLQNCIYQKIIRNHLVAS
jgi:hypothetical protein